MKGTESLRAVAYIRVSDLSQVDGYSLDAQEREFNEYCKRRGWTPIRIYREEGKSAHTDIISKRPQFKQLLDDAAKSEFDIAVVHSIDRWSRSQKVSIESLGILGKAGVTLVSISEEVDYTTPQGKFFMGMLSGMAELFSDSVGFHVSKGLKQRAISGRHTGGLPLGYQSCWIEENGERKRLCDPEHPGGIHLIPHEAAAIIHLFTEYADGKTTLAMLAGWMNEQGHRTRNTRKMKDGHGNLVAGPRLFTTASIRGILHNPFYYGMIKHKGELYQGVHDAIITQEIYEQVEDSLRKNSGRSTTLNPTPEREYLLKGIARCAWCLMPMWSQTYKSGQSYYREHRNSRSIAHCPSAGGAISCEVPDEQIGAIMSSLELGPKWQEQVLVIIEMKDEADRVKTDRRKAREKLQRLGRAYVDGVYDENEYSRQRRRLELQLESLIVPEVDAAEEAGRLIEELPELWNGANKTERRDLLLTMLDAVYVDAKVDKRVVAIKPKAPFRPIFEVATTKEGSGVVLVKEPRDVLSETEQLPQEDEEAATVPCSWWRRGRVELYREHGIHVLLAA
jgi:DNA invertase Pin-like site-specific DNA recombinase